MGDGPLSRRLPTGSELWLDGAHNVAAAKPVARALRTLARGREVVLICGILANKDAGGIIATLAPSISRVIAVPVPGHAHHSPSDLAQVARLHDLDGDAADDLTAAVDRVRMSVGPPLVLIAGSLYLAGDALRLNDELPT